MEDFERMLRENLGPLERFIRFRMSGTGEAEDLLQEVCLTACEKFRTLRDPEKFKPWILQIARNKCRDHYRSGRPGAVSLETAEPFLSAADCGAEGPVREALGSLPETDRKMLELTYFSELSQSEIARMLRIPVGTVKSRMHTAKDRFRAVYPYKTKGMIMMKELPDIMPEYTITPSKEAPFPVKWEELMGWFIVPREGEKLKWAMYDFPERKRTMSVEIEAAGRAKVHGIEGVRIRAVEHDPVESEQIGEWKDVERFFIAQLTDTHCRVLAESHVNEEGITEYYTFLDGDEFLDNWGFGPENCGNETNLRQKGQITQEGSIITTRDTDWPLDITGRFTVTIGGRQYDTVCVWDVECYGLDGVCGQQFLDRNGRTVLWRRFNRDDWNFSRYGKLWTELLPDNERVTVNGRTFVHWYDCITDYLCG